MYNFLSFPAFSIGGAKHKILLAKSYILFFGRIIFKKKRGRKNKKIIWWPNTIFWNCMIRPVAESNKKKYIIRPVAESNKKKCLIRPKLLAESHRYRRCTVKKFARFLVVETSKIRFNRICGYTLYPLKPDSFFTTPFWDLFEVATASAAPQSQKSCG